MSSNFNIKIRLSGKGRVGPDVVKMRKVVVDDLRDFLMFEGESLLARIALIDKVIDTDVYTLTEGDLDLLFSHIRTMVNDPVLSNTFECDKEGCEGIITYRLDLRKVKIHSLPSDYEKDHELTLPVCKDTIQLCVLTVKELELISDYLELYDDKESDVKNKDLTRDDVEFLASHAAMLKDVVDISTLDERVTYIRNLDVTDFSLLVVYRETFKTGPELLTPAVCDECKTKYNIKISIDSKMLGLSLASLLNKYKFLVKSNVSFSDFLQYTIPELNSISSDLATKTTSKSRKVTKIANS